MPATPVEAEQSIEGLWLVPVRGNVVFNGEDGTTDRRVAMLARGLSKDRVLDHELVRMPYVAEPGLVLGEFHSADGSIEATLAERDVKVGGVTTRIDPDEWESRLEHLVGNQSNYVIQLVTPHRFFASVRLLGLPTSDTVGMAVEEYDVSIPFVVLSASR